MPDLVLVPALLSPQDDAALAAALRVIAAAAHVRTLTIPLLANESKEEAKSGLLSRWRRGKNASPTPDGCDPHVFAEQISAYLAEAAAERAALKKEADELANAPFVEAPVVDPAILKAAIVEAVSMSNAVVNDTIVDRTIVRPAFDDYAIVNGTMLDRGFVDQRETVDTIVEHDVTDRSIDYVAGNGNGNGHGHRPHVDDIPAFAYAATSETIAEPAIADANVTDQPRSVVFEDDAVVVDSPVVAYVDSPVAAYEEPAFSLPDLLAPFPVARVAQQPEAVVDERHDSRTEANADEDIDLSSEIADIAVEEEPVVERVERPQLRVGSIFGFNDYDFSDRRAVRKPAVVAPPLEESAPDLHAVAHDGADESVIDPMPADVAPAEPFAVEEAPATMFAIDELVADELVLEEFAIEGVAAAEEPAAPELVVHARVIEEPAVAPHVLEARAAFEQAEVMALAHADDAVLTEFAAHVEPEANDTEAWASGSLNKPSNWPALEGVPAEIVIEPVKPEPVRPVAAVAPPARDVREREWTELVASLRQDIERRRVEPQQAAKPKRPTKKGKATQDEWGFFDPEQCGFAALLAKLDEITDSPDERDLPRH